METFGVIKGSIVTLIAIAIATALITSMDLLRIEIGSPSPFGESFESRQTQQELVAALKETLPIYANSVMTDPKLSDQQRESIEVLYLPIINEFIESGDADLIEKANVSKMLILNNKISATISERRE